MFSSPNHRTLHPFPLAIIFAAAVSALPFSPAAATPPPTGAVAAVAVTSHKVPKRAIVLRPRGLPADIKARIKVRRASTYHRVLRLSAHTRHVKLRPGKYHLKALPTSGGRVTVSRPSVRVTRAKGARVDVRWVRHSKTSPAPAEPVAPVTPTPAPDPSRPASQRGRSWYQANTGVPAGMDLRATGPLRITENGTVVDGMRVNGGIEINARNVTIRNSLVLGPITNTLPGDRYNNGVWDQNLVIDHVEVDLSDVPIGTSQVRAINSAWGTTVRYAKLHGMSQGISVAGHMEISDSYFFNIRSTGAHSEAILGNGNPLEQARDIVIQRNWLDASDDDAKSASGSTYISGALCLYGDFGRIRDVLISDNYLSGAGYLLYAGAVAGKPYPVPASVVVEGNVFDPQGWGAVYPAPLDAESNARWAGNTRVDGQAVPLPR